MYWLYELVITESTDIPRSTAGQAWQYQHPQDARQSDSHTTSFPSLAMESDTQQR